MGFFMFDTCFNDLDLCSRSQANKKARTCRIILVYEVSKTYAMVDDMKKVTAKKFGEYGEYGSFKHLWLLLNLHAEKVQVVLEM